MGPQDDPAHAGAGQGPLFGAAELGPDLIEAWWSRFVERRKALRTAVGERAGGCRLKSWRAKLERLLEHVSREEHRGAHDLTTALEAVDHVLDVVESEVQRERWSNYRGTPYDRLQNFEPSHWLRHSNRNGWANFDRLVTRSVARPKVPGVWEPEYRPRPVAEIEADLASRPKVVMDRPDF